MEILRFEETENSYWYYHDNDIIGFMLLKEGKEEAEEYKLSLHQLNVLFFTEFNRGQLIQAIQQQEDKDFAELVETVIQYSETPNITIIKAIRLFQELFGNIVEIDESTINTSKTSMGYQQFMSDGIVVFVINRYGVIIRIAFTDSYLPTFFDTLDIIEIDVFNNLSKDILLNKLIEHYVIGLPIVREELKISIRNYTRKKKIDTILN